MTKKELEKAIDDILEECKDLDYVRAGEDSDEYPVTSFDKYMCKDLIIKLINDNFTSK